MLRNKELDFTFLRRDLSTKYLQLMLPCDQSTEKILQLLQYSLSLEPNCNLKTDVFSQVNHSTSGDNETRITLLCFFPSCLTFLWHCSLGITLGCYYFSGTYSTMRILEKFFQNAIQKMNQTFSYKISSWKLPSFQRQNTLMIFQYFTLALRAPFVLSISSWYEAKEAGTNKCYARGSQRLHSVCWDWCFFSFLTKNVYL